MVVIRSKKGVSRKKKKWLEKSLKKEKQQKAKDPKAYKKTLNKRRESVEKSQPKEPKKTEPTPIVLKAKEKTAREKVLDPLVGKESPAFEATAASRETLGAEKEAILGKTIPQVGGALVAGYGIKGIIGAKSVAANKIMLESRMGLLKLSGKAGTLSPGKIVTVPSGLGAIGRNAAIASR